MFDLRSFIDASAAIVDRHAQDRPGAYGRWRPDEDAPNPYGCADSANILYTIGRFPCMPEERAAWIDVLQSLQRESDGLFHEATHHPIHTTAHCIAALELFDALPRHPLKALVPYHDQAVMESFLDALDWGNDPWGASHQGAGLYAALVLAREVEGPWEDRYFDWLADNTDIASGLLRKGSIGALAMENGETVFPHLAGTFHYLFNQIYARRPIPRPHALIDTCLTIAKNDPFPLGTKLGFAEIDWVFCLSRSVRQCGHRFAASRNALVTFANRYIPFLLRQDPKISAGLNDLHTLFGVLCCLAELQQAVPGLLRSERPLRLVLDRRPFI